MSDYENADTEYTTYSYIGKADGLEYASWEEAIEANSSN
jgi:hypothetical protein